MSTSRETVLSLVYKIASVGGAFVGVSLLVRHMGPAAYGAWATLVSALAWIQLSDLGIGIVIRNRVAADRADGALHQSIATALALTGVIGLVLVVLYAAAWRHVSVVRDYPLESALMYISAFLMLPASVGTNILQGLGLTRVTFQVALWQSLLWLAFIVCLGSRPSITALALGFSVLWAGVCFYQLHRGLRELGLANAAFLRRLAHVRPSRDTLAMMRVGGAFFVLQMAGLVLFNLGTWLTYTSFSPADAARYDILNKIYQVPLMLFNVVIAVAWSRIAAQARVRDAARLHAIQVGLLAVAAAGILAMFVVSGFVVRPFVVAYSHGQIGVSMREVMAFSTQASIQCLAFAGAVFMNAVERLRIQILFAVASALVFVPMFQLLRLAGFDVASVPLSTALAILPGALWFNLYVRRHIIGPMRAPEPSVR